VPRPTDCCSSEGLIFVELSAFIGDFVSVGVVSMATAILKTNKTYYNKAKRFV
jgi:hypothetical protein